MLSLPKPMQHDLLDCAGFIPVREPNTVLEFIVKINSKKPDIIKPYVFITMKISTEAGMTLNTNKQTLNRKLIKSNAFKFDSLTNKSFNIHGTFSLH